MANENLHIDENTRWVLGGITNDANEEIRNFRVNPVTGRVLVEAVIASTNTSIGGTIPGGTPGSVLFIGPGSTLDQDNPNLFYDYTNFFLGLGTNTPDATLTVDGSVHFDLGGDATGDIFYRDAGGFLAPLGIGTAGQVLAVSGGLPSWVAATSLVSGYNTIQDGGTPLTQRSTMNFVNYFDVTDVSSVTTININTAQLGADTMLISTLETNLDLANISGQINLATQVTGLLPPANIDITNLQSTLDLGSIAGQIDLTTQVTGVLPLANGGTGSALTDPNYDAAYVWDNTTNTTRLANLSGLTYDSGTNTLTASGGGGTGTALETTVSQTSHGLSVGDVIKVSGTNTFAKAQADSEVNSEAVGVVTTVVNANSFKYVSSAIQLAYAPVGAPGSAVWLDPTVAGGMTATKPSTVGQVARALGTIIESGVTMYFDIAALAEVIGTTGGTGSGKYILDMTAFNTVTSAGGYSLAYTESISGNIIGDTNALRVSLINARFDTGNDTTCGVRLKYNGTTISDIQVAVAAGNNPQFVDYWAIIASNGATNSQRTVSRCLTGPSYLSNPQVAIDQKSSSVDSTTTYDLTVEFYSSGGVVTDINCDGILIELIA